MEYPIPKHIKDFFQLVGANNNEYEARSTIKCSCGSEIFSVYQSNNKMIVKLICYCNNGEKPVALLPVGYILSPKLSLTRRKDLNELSREI